MRVALAVNRISGTWSENLETIENMARKAAKTGAKLVLFPETALTGLVNNDDPEHDLPLGQPIPGPATDRLAEVARSEGIYLALGMFEQDAGRLYDSAVMIDPQGDIVLKYRRISKGWRDPAANSIYSEGEEIGVAHTDLGSFAFLICGDLFDDQLVARVKELQPDYLLFPFARNFNDSSWDQARWDREEQPRYIERAKLAGATTLMVNYLADPEWDPDCVFGGAMIVSGQGELLGRLQLGLAGLLVADLPEKR